MRQMPPWHIDRSIGEYLEDPSLSDAEIATIVAWVDGGTAQGNLADAPPPVQFADNTKWTYGEPDLIVKMPEAYPVPSSGRDVYRTFVLPLNLKEDVWIKGVDFRPGARPVVHHVLFYADATGNARQRDAQDALPGFAGGMGGGLVGGGAIAALTGGR